MMILHLDNSWKWRFCIEAIYDMIILHEGNSSFRSNNKIYYQIHVLSFCHIDSWAYYTCLIIMWRVYQYLYLYIDRIIYMFTMCTTSAWYQHIVYPICLSDYGTISFRLSNMKINSVGDSSRPSLPLSLGVQRTKFVFSFS